MAGRMHRMMRLTMSDSYWSDMVRGCEGFADVARIREKITTALGPSEDIRKDLLLQLDNVHATLLANDKDKRKDVLLKAAYDILNTISSTYHADALMTTATWDDAECDGFCLLDELQDLLEED